jgi:hypothetical protein
MKAALVAKDWDRGEGRRMVAWLTPKGEEVVSRLRETVDSPVVLKGVFRSDLTQDWIEPSQFSCAK